MTQKQHETVLLHEAVEALNITESGVYVDGTFGRGGHSRLILERLGPAGRLVALDRDLSAVAVGRTWQDARFEIVHARFSSMKDELLARHIERVDGILLDLGVSSPQLDEAARGFSFRFDAPLDMRMDQSQGVSAAQWLADVDEKTLAQVLWEYGDERYSRQIARAICHDRAIKPITTTAELAGLVARVIGHRREPGQHPATRTFQAIRIFINEELSELDRLLEACVGLLAPGGRLAIISFHSLEDRRVKQFMKREERPERDLPARLPVPAHQLPQARLRVVGKAVKPGPDEVAHNPRARSAVLRVAERTGEA